MTVLVSLIAWCAVFGVLGGLVTNAKGRGWGEGVALGAVFGVIGLAISAFMRPGPAAGPERGWYPCPSGDDERYWNGRAWSDLPPRRVGH